jgi:superfamily II DNA/RNA helicase
MLEQNHFKELNLLLARLNEDQRATNERQTFVFSATLTRWASKIKVGPKR